MLRLLFCFLMTAAPVWAADLVDEALIAEMAQADVVILGEVHDNSRHHVIQAEIVARLQPKAMVWEMITDEMAQRLASLRERDQEAVARVLNWAHSGWPGFDMYFPIFEAGGGVPVYGGAVPRALALAAIEGGAEVALGGVEEAEALGVQVPLPPEELTARKAAQLEAHCGALPEDMLPKMVSIQRVRDAKLARGTLLALMDTGGPVVVITGNGHARKDWGMPVYLARAAPKQKIFALGQSEDGALRGTFDAVIDSPAVERPDPCLAFQSDG